MSAPQSRWSHCETANGECQANEQKKTNKQFLLTFGVHSLTIGGMKTSAAVKHFGTRRRLCDALGIKDVSSIAHWGEIVPIGRQYQLQLLTAGLLIARPTQKAPKVAA